MTDNLFLRLPRLGSALLGLVGAAFALGVAVPARAHHSYAEFDATKTVKLDATVVAFEWTNPHSRLKVMVQQAAAAPASWDLEGGGPLLLRRRGIKPTDLHPGDKIVIMTNPRRDGSLGGSLVTVSLADGRVLTFR